MPKFTAIFLTFAIAFAQTPAPQALQQQTPDTVIRINVNLVQVDATVVDGKGQPVTDLKKEDFVLLQDGKPQALTNFSFVNTKEGVVRNTSPRRPPNQPRPSRVRCLRRRWHPSRNRFAARSLL